jgi:hypothetical protein
MPEHFKQNSHTLLGTFSSSLPVGIFVWLIFYWLAAPAVFLLPDPHREAIRLHFKPRLVSVQQALGVTSGILIGAWTHVLWDSFTHQQGWIVKHTPLLRRPFFGNMPAFKGLQYLSSVLGLCIVLYAYNKWMKASGFQLWTWRRPCWRFYLWLGIALICLAATAIEGHPVNAITSLYTLHGGRFALEFLTTFLRNILIALCAVSIGAKLLGFHRSESVQ